MVTLYFESTLDIVLTEDGKLGDGSLLGDANGLEPGTGRQKESGKWQRPRFTRKALMRCCLVKWIIASTGPKEQALKIAERAERITQVIKGVERDT
ncbi:hypothetical protein PO909_018143 [Leuciscus waleckii]